MPRDPRAGRSETAPRGSLRMYPAPAPRSAAAAPSAAWHAIAISQGSLGYLLSALGPCLILLARDLAVPRSGLAWVAGGVGAGLLLLGVVGERLLAVGVWRVLRMSVAGLALG